MAGMSIRKHEVNLASDHETIIHSQNLADQVKNDINAVVQHISEVIGPINPSEISIDQYGKVVIKNGAFAAAAKVAIASPLDNFLCNHHLICKS